MLKIFSRILFVFVLIASAITSAMAQDFSGETVRVWSVDGRKVNATLIGYKNRQVTLRSEAGTEKAFPLDKIGAADRTYIRKKLDPAQATALDANSATEITRILRESVVKAPSSNQFRGTVTADKVVGRSDDGIGIVSWSHRNGLTLWNRVNGEIIGGFSGCASGNETISVSPRGTTYATASGVSEVAICDTATDEQVFVLEGHTKPVKVVAFNSDGSLLASGGDDGLVIIWDTETGQKVQQLEGHTARITAVAFHPFGETVLTGAADDTARLWNIKSGNQTRILESRDVGGPVTLAAFADDGNVAAVVSVGKVILWATPQVDPKTRAAATTTMTSSSGGGSAPPKTVLGTEQKLVVITPQQKTVPPEATFDSLAFGHLGAYLLLGTKAGTAICSNVLERLHIRKVEQLASGVVRVAFGETQYATGSFDDSTIVWDAANGDNVLQIPGHSYGVMPIAFAGGGRFTLTSGGWNDTSICLRETATGKLLQRFVGHPGPVLSMTLSSDALRLVSISADRDTPQLAGAKRTKPLTKTLIIWDTGTGRKLCEQSGLDLAAVSDSCKTILSATGRSATGNVITPGGSATVTFWNAATGASINSGSWAGVGDNWLLEPSGARLFATDVQVKRTNDKGETVQLDGLMVRNTRSGDVVGSPLKLRYDPLCTAWSPDGKRMLTAVANNAELWGTQGSEKPTVVFPHKAAVSAVAVGDATTFLTGSIDGVATLWTFEEREVADEQGRTRRENVPIVLKTFAGKVAVVGVGFAGDNNSIVLVGCEDGTVTAHAR
ncbi:MAG: hypothetical protein ACRC46_00640 [Thermoguttaceae bacterium]